MNRVEQIIDSLNPTVAHIIFGGDLNTDLARSSPHVKALNQYINDNNMIANINLNIADVTYTYIGTKSTPRVDHFIVSQGLGSSVNTFTIIDNHLFSDHVPICVSFDIQIDHLIIQDRPL